MHYQFHRRLVNIEQAGEADAGGVVECALCGWPSGDGELKLALAALGALGEQPLARVGQAVLRECDCPAHRRVRPPRAEAHLPHLVHLASE